MILRMKDGLHPLKQYNGVHQIIIDKVKTVNGVSYELNIWYENNDLGVMQHEKITNYELNQINIAYYPTIICDTLICIKQRYKNNRITLQIEQDDVIIKKRFAWGEIPIINLYYNEI